MATVGRVAQKVREIRIHLCQTGASSKGVRDFLTDQYCNLKKSNPHLPILVRECSGVQPTLWVRFGKGKESSVSLKDACPDDVIKKLNQLTG